MMQKTDDKTFEVNSSDIQEQIEAKRDDSSI